MIYSTFFYVPSRYPANYMLKKIAAIQMNSGMDLSQNLALARTLLKEASDKGATLAVLPEMFPLLGSGCSFTSKKLLIKEKEGSGQIQRFLSEQARELGIWIIGGTIPLESNDQNKTYASCLVFNNKGTQVARYDKIHLFDVTLSPSESYRESDTTMPGDKIVVVDTPLGRIGLSVCYDIRFPELYRALFNLGADIIVIPSAFTLQTGKEHWEILARARAIENFSYVVCSAQWGKHGDSRETYGNTLIVAPSGQIIAHLEEGNGVVLSEIDSELIKAQRKRMPVKDHQRITILPDLSTL